MIQTRPIILCHQASRSGLPRPSMRRTQLNATAEMGGNFVYTPASGTVLNAGNGQTLHVDFTPTDTTGYNNASKDVTIDVGKAPLSITADANVATLAVDHFSKTYDGHVYSGFRAGESRVVKSETETALGGTLSFSGAGTTTTAAGGPYTVTPGGQTSSNYEITFVNGALDISRAPLSITADANVATVGVDHFSKTYDGHVYSGFTARYYGFVNGETTAGVSGTLSFSGAGTTGTPAAGRSTATPAGATTRNG